MPMVVRTMKEFAQECVDRAEHNFDALMIIESGGERGLGKTVFALLLDMWVAMIKGFKFDLKDMLVFDPTSDKIVDRVKNRPDAYPVHVDEAGKVAYKRNYNKGYQIKLIIFLNVCRKFRKVIPFCHPSFLGLDTDLRDLAFWRIIILERGTALVFGKVKNPNAKDKWMVEESEKIINEHTQNKKMDTKAVINAMRTLPNYLFEVHFSDIEPETYAVYEKMSKDAEIEAFLAQNTDRWKIEAEAATALLWFWAARRIIPLSTNEITKAINIWVRERTGNSTLTFPRESLKVLSERVNATLYFENLRSIFGPHLLDRSAPTPYGSGAGGIPLSLKIRNTNENNTTSEAPAEPGKEAGEGTEAQENLFGAEVDEDA